MLLIIFGAGASYDVLPPATTDRQEKDGKVVRYRPPLATQLFETRPNFVDAVRRFRASKYLISLLRARSETSSAPALEQVLDKYQREAKEDTRRYEELVAIRLYLRDILSHCIEWIVPAAEGTNYDALLSRVDYVFGRHEDVLLATFNYDLLLEHAVSRFAGPGQRSIDWYVSSSYKYIKLHGSVDWWREVDPDVVAPPGRRLERTLYRELLTHAEILMTSDAVTDNFVVSLNIDEPSENLLFPAIALPVEAKDDTNFECPSTHLQVLKERIPDVTKVLIIGWRGNEPHFVKFLIEAGLPNGIPALIVSENKKGAGETQEYLRTRGLGLMYKPVSETFSQLVGGDLLDAFLTGHVF